MSDEAQRKAYRQTQENWRCALAMTGELDYSELRLALLMLQCSNRTKFYEIGSLISWQTVETWSSALDCHDRTIQRARVSLERRGIINRLKGGHGTGDPVHFRFNNDWLAKRVAAIDASLSDKSANALAGQVPFISPRAERETRTSPLSSKPGADERETRTSGRETRVSSKGDTAMSPNPSDDPHDLNPLPSLRDGARLRERDCWATKDLDSAASSSETEWPGYALAWMANALVLDGRRTARSMYRVCDALAREYGIENVLMAMDYTAGQTSGDSIATLRGVIKSRLELGG